MTPLTTQDLKEIIAHDLPGHELVAHAALADDVDAGAVDHPTVVEADEPGVDIAELRAKFLGKETPGYDGVTADTPPVNEHDQIVAVRPTDAADPFDHRARPKAVVVSGRERRVIGEQG